MSQTIDVINDYCIISVGWKYSLIVSYNPLEHKVVYWNSVGKFKIIKIALSLKADFRSFNLVPWNGKEQNSTTSTHVYLIYIDHVLGTYFLKNPYTFFFFLLIIRRCKSNNKRVLFLKSHSFFFCIKGTRQNKWKLPLSVSSVLSAPFCFYPFVPFHGTILWVEISLQKVLNKNNTILVCHTKNKLWLKLV